MLLKHPDQAGAGCMDFVTNNLLRAQHPESEVHLLPKLSKRQVIIIMIITGNFIILSIHTVFPSTR